MHLRVKQPLVVLLSLMLLLIWLFEIIFLIVWNNIFHYDVGKLRNHFRYFFILGRHREHWTPLPVYILTQTDKVIYTDSSQGWHVPNSGTVHIDFWLFPAGRLFVGVFFGMPRLFCCLFSHFGFPVSVRVWFSGLGQYFSGLTPYFIIFRKSTKYFQAFVYVKKKLNPLPFGFSSEEKRKRPRASERERKS